MTVSLEWGNEMIQYFYTKNNRTMEITDTCHDCWIKLTNPTMEEAQMIAEKMHVEVDDLMAAIDLEEKTRIELPEEYTLIVIDIPSEKFRSGVRAYVTIPLGIIITKDAIATICSEETFVLRNFERNRIVDFSTRKKLRFVYQILLECALLYQKALYSIDHKRQEIEEKVRADVEEEDLFSLHELESTLVYFATSIRENGNVLDRLTRYSRLERFPEDTELLDDAIVENQQAIEMTDIYRSIVEGTRQMMSTVFDNRLNNVMKILTSITLILAIPTVISGMYGMNVLTKYMPFADTPHGFAIISGIVVMVCIGLLIILKRKRML